MSNINGRLGHPRSGVLGFGSMIRIGFGDLHLASSAAGQASMHMSPLP